MGGSREEQVHEKIRKNTSNCPRKMRCVQCGTTEVKLLSNIGQLDRFMSCSHL